jgi:hypothetical protein
MSDQDKSSPVLIADSGVPDPYKPNQKNPKVPAQVPKITPKPQVPKKFPKPQGRGLIIVEIIRRILDAGAAGGKREVDWERRNRERQAENTPPSQSTEWDKTLYPTDVPDTKKPLKPAPIKQTPTTNPNPVDQPPLQPDQIPKLPWEQPQTQPPQKKPTTKPTSKPSQYDIDYQKRQAESKRQEDSRRKDYEASDTSDKRKAAILDKFSKMRNDALDALPDNLDSYELAAAIKVWDKRKDQLDKVLEEREKAFEKWKRINPTKPERDWLNGLGKKYFENAEDLLRQWKNLEKKRPSKKPEKPVSEMTMDEYRKFIEENAARRNVESQGNGNSKPTASSDQAQQPADPKKEGQGRSSDARWEQTATSIERDLQKRISSGDKQKNRLDKELRDLKGSLERLREQGIEPATVENLYNNGMLPSDLVKHLKTVSVVNVTSVSLQEAANLTDQLLAQMAPQRKRIRGELPTNENERTVTEKTVQNAVQDKKLYGLIKEIINSGKLRNPEQLMKATNHFLTQADASAAKGPLLELEIAAKLAKEKKYFYLEKGADIFNETDNVAIQAKNADGQAEIKGKILEAAEQLNGTNEVPAPGAKKTAYVKISNPENRDYNKTPKELKKIIESSLNSSNKYPDLLKRIDQVQVEIGDRTYMFDIKDGVVKYRKGYSSDRLLSDISPDLKNPIVATHKSQALSELQAALKNYANMNDDSSKTSLLQSIKGVSTNVNLSLAKLQLQFLNMGNEQEVREQPVEVAQAITRTRESNNIGGL